MASTAAGEGPEIGIPKGSMTEEIQPFHSKVPAPQDRLRDALNSLWLGNEDQGIAELRSLVRDEPDYLEGWGNLGHHLILRGDLEEAIGCCKRILEIQPELTEAVVRMAECYDALGQRAQAHATYRSQEGKPFYHSPDWQQRLVVTAPLWERFFLHGPKHLPRLLKRVLQPPFLKAFLGEVARFPRSLEGIGRSGWGSYLSYLNLHYLETRSYLLPIDPCDFCGSKTARAIFFHRQAKIVKCQTCGLEFVERRPPEGQDVAEKAFDQDATLHAFEAMWNDPVLNRVRREHLEGLYRQAGRTFPAPGERLLEIGCGQGHKIAALRDAGMEVVGTETGEKVVRQARERFESLRVDLKTVRGLDYEKGSFDHVMAYHVLEHLDHPSELFQQANRLLRPGGYLFIEIPASNLREHSRNDQLNPAAGYANPAHMTFFQPETAAAYFPLHGFRLVSQYLRIESHFPVGGFLGRKEAEEGIG
jgi:SAM-dependent methyltransferase